MSTLVVRVLSPLIAVGMLAVSALATLTGATIPVVVGLHVFRHYYG